MKAIGISLLFIIAIEFLMAQDYQITFTGSGQSTIVDSVEVFNLSRGTLKTVYGEDVLHLVHSNGFNDFQENTVNLFAYPNPMNTFTRIEFYNLKADQKEIEIFDIKGKLVARQSDQVQQGTITYEISGLTSGIYTVQVTSDEWKSSTKIISTSVENKITTIKIASSDYDLKPPKIFKNTNILVEMEYNYGERLLFRGFSGNCSHVSTLIPIQSQTFNFEFIPCTDGDGNSYSVVTVGSQTWMAENLKTTHYSNGTEIPNVTDDNSWKTLSNGAYCWQNNDPACKSTYGAIYNWYTVNDTNNLCPTGWHVPSDSEWTVLTSYLGSTNTGGKIKSTRTEPIAHPRWNTPNTDATNESGFSGLPGGARYSGDGTFIGPGDLSLWWSSSENGDNIIWARKLQQMPGDLERELWDANNGLSVRCLKD